MAGEDRAARAAAADEWCRKAYESYGGPGVGVALVALGGYGRGELAPYSDLDLVLVGEDGIDLDALAGQLFYPLWDAGYRVDHSVRSHGEVLRAAADDVRVALGLLDLRHVAGDTHLALRLRTELLADWRRTARTRLREVEELTRRRHRTVGEFAHLSVPDVKEAAGGLRDACVLRALVATWLVDVPHTDLERCRTALLDVRDHLHDIHGRGVDRIHPEAWDELAVRLGLDGAYEAQRYVRQHGRRLAHLSRLVWRRVDTVIDDRPRPGPRRPRLTTLAPGIAEAYGEVVLARHANPATDPLLLLRAAAEAAERDLTLAPATAARLVAESPPLPDPWPRPARDLLVRLLAAGEGLRGVWETLEETGAVHRILPEWERIRLLPHASPIHRFTVDRHVVETCVESSRLIRRVARPDLLVVAALLHDIGKGQASGSCVAPSSSHSVAGAPVAGEVARRMGFDAVDQAVVASLVRWHLLLPEIAVGRDLDDPVTTEEVASRVGTQLELSLLAALTEADALAASPQAWSRWRAQLVGGLVSRVDAALVGVQGAACDAMEPDEVEVPGDLADGRAAVSFEVHPYDHGARVTVVARDRVGLLADVSAVLGLQRATVRSARAWGQLAEDGAGETSAEWGVSVWEVDQDHLDPALLRHRLEALLRDRGIADRLHRGDGDQLPPTVVVRPEASRSATVLEVRATDRPGLLHRVLTAVADLGMTVRSAHVDTLGPQAVDVFYLCEAGAGALGDLRAAEAANAVRAALAVSTPPMRTELGEAGQ